MASREDQRTHYYYWNLRVGRKFHSQEVATKFQLKILCSVTTRNWAILSLCFSIKKITASLNKKLYFLPSPRTLHWKQAGVPSQAEVLAVGEMMTGGATVAGESGETTSETATQEPESVQIQPLTMSAWTLTGPWWVLGQSLTGLLVILPPVTWTTQLWVVTPLMSNRW